MAKSLACKPRIKYIQGNQTMLDDVKVLWEALNQHQLERSTYFRHHFVGMTFEKRKTDLLKKAENGPMHLEVAVDEASGQGVGYLISSVNAEKVGEIDSIFVSKAYRGMGIGDWLVQDALAWMDQKGAVEKIVETSVGNEQVWGFYGRFGFLPRKTLLKQVKKA